MNIILASQSPRRRELLGQMGLSHFKIVVPKIDEDMGRDMAPHKLVEAISAEKAKAVAETAGADALVIAADTVVVLDGTVLGKPADKAEAASMLTALSARTHRVYTGFTVCRGATRITQSECTAVTFRALTAEEIDAYVRTGEPMDKAGAYGIQGMGSLLVEGISGDYFNVVGLPVCALGRVLTQFGVNCLERSS